MLKILSVRFSSTQHGNTGTFWHTKTWYSSKSVAPCKQYLEYLGILALNIIHEALI